LDRVGNLWIFANDIDEIVEQVPVFEHERDGVQSNDGFVDVELRLDFKSKNNGLFLRISDLSKLLERDVILVIVLRNLSSVDLVTHSF